MTDNLRPASWTDAGYSPNDGWRCPHGLIAAVCRLCPAPEMACDPGDADAEPWPLEPARRVYIAGPMKGLPEFNFPAFMAAEARLLAAGWAVFNPARADIDLDGFDPSASKPESHEYYMRRDLPELAAGCDAIALLPGWRESRGARAELRVAVECGLEVIDAETMDPLPLDRDAIWSDEMDRDAIWSDEMDRDAALGLALLVVVFFAGVLLGWLLGWTGR